MSKRYEGVCYDGAWEGRNLAYGRARLGGSPGAKKPTGRKMLLLIEEGGRNSSLSPEICATFQRDILRRHF
jgi:hypothetical protein